ncbi:hypothetical protein TanjilG_07376 [Lupinus angustifolius]|uniref:DUF4408 domain-containing protein n=1 Tax=Lupinus angustifolius TaxID=3871 RepID=A0A4P1R0Z0_LUPAN|nr:PREDICTED: probable inactive protein kinase DDB_G0270444 [Lupinus angustifolius]OIV98941.1 hypothetical protein TanjilG_07376 [Lupinus angustifolius]
MLDSILEFITQAASSSAFIFCFCNLIIIIILVDLKPSLSIHQQSEIPLSIYTNIKQETNSKILVEKDVGSSPQEAKISHVKEREEAEVYEEAKASAMNKIEVKDNDDLSNEEEKKEEVEDGNEEEEDDELKRRVEEFIEKVNRGWKQELLSTPV